METNIHPIVLTAPKGMVGYLKAEVMELGYTVLWASENALGTRGDFDAAMRLNLWVRTAHHVLYQLKEFACNDLNALYREINRLPWEKIIPVKEYISVVSTVDHPSIRDHRIVNLKCKDAIVDRIAEIKGRRPNSGSEKTGAVIVVYWNRNRCTVSLDTSGESLSKRGYRKIPLRAPMQETLAAAVVMATGYTGRGAFVNPMCGSGTCAIEAALIAENRAPGLTRSNFGFMHTLLYDEQTWSAFCEDARKNIRKQENPENRIIASDIDRQVIDAARQNAQSAGVRHVIDFTVADFTNTTIPSGAGVIFFNPEYGIRLGNENELIDTYRSIGNFMKRECSGYRGYVFTGNTRLAGKVGLKSGKKINFKNGNIDCRLYEYILFEGKDK